MPNKTAAALGLFDGVHLGHRAVLQAAAAQSADGLTPAAFTFQPELASAIESLNSDSIFKKTRLPFQQSLDSSRMITD